LLAIGGGAAKFSTAAVLLALSAAACDVERVAVVDPTANPMFGQVDPCAFESVDDAPGFSNVEDARELCWYIQEIQGDTDCDEMRSYLMDRLTTGYMYEYVPGPDSIPNELGRSYFELDSSNDADSEIGLYVASPNFWFNAARMLRHEYGHVYTGHEEEHLAAYHEGLCLP
jgi:hypothetical protein